MNETEENQQTLEVSEPKKKPIYQRFKQLGYVFLLIILLILFALYLLSPPSDLGSYPKTVVIEEGMSLKAATALLESRQIIRSDSLANTYITFTAGDGNVVSGTYIFKHPHTLRAVVEKITTGDFGLLPVTITIPEGLTHKEIAILFEASLPDFNAEVFLAYTQKAGIYEGYLFPDTYKFLPTVTEQTVAETLYEQFNDVISSSEIIQNSSKTLEDIVLMGSIIEKEASNTSRQEVSDILWKRLAIDMPLQVDATFVYSIEKGTADLTLSDLEDETNPYNSYIYRGFPPTAISNPGLASLEAAAAPQNTDYLFFLTGNDGEMYYAETFNQHVRNKNLYLR